MAMKPIQLAAPVGAGIARPACARSLAAAPRCAGDAAWPAPTGCEAWW